MFDERQRGRASWLGPSLVAALGLLTGALLAVLGAAPAAAHVELQESEPQNISTTEGPIDEIRLTFSAAADPVGDQFQLLDASDTSLPIASIRNDGESVLVVSPETPITAGRTRLTWAIRSGDSHTMTGSVSFTVSGATIAGATPTSQPSVSASDRSAPEEASGGGGPVGRTWADHLASLGRWVVYASLFLCVGGLTYLAWVHRGSEREGRQLVFYVRRAAVVVLAASALEWLAQLMAFRSGDLWAVFAPDAWGDLATTGFAKGTLLRLVGAGLVLGFLRIDHVDHHFWSSDLGLDPFDTALGGTSAVDVADRSTTTVSRLRVEASPMAFVGAGALVVSEAFIGHTATVSPRWLVLIADAGHLLAGAAWVAGALLLLLTLNRRRRRGAPLDAHLLATRFSALATWALAGVLVTGVALSWSILRTPSALWGTEFGRVLLLKLIAVAVAVMFGAHNHRVLVPTLSEVDDEPAHRFRRFLSVEVALFGAILLLTALLVVANPT